ncbi:TerB family tellurite resistance protein [Pseudochryseolinea flava]|uniref:TerB family tellurite resistance protein n=1 Tax=Pseudochryseolinea flava TaxID=2059302 RepID=A0A364XW49_9BACT|nr:TerB family tellurite resistance protein [Pseudochryseolinea flava]RAV98558.1 hypothetical protein DQQ10_22735 [Pseudochryseolinea flava]
MTTFFEHQRTSFKRNYLSNLIALASSDGNLDELERQLIHKIGKKRGLKEWQINELLEDQTPKQAFVPDSIHNRMEMLYDLMQIIYADEKVTDDEVDFITDIVRAYKLKLEIVDHLIAMFSTGTPLAYEWKEFVDRVTLETYEPRPTIL